MTTVVLGWDGLDYQLAEQFGVLDSFGESHGTFETVDNPIIDEPHTLELWPSMITGLSADDHGLNAVSEDGANWESQWLKFAAAVGQRTVPDSVRTEIGKRLRNAGATVDQESASYYDDEGLWTVFDDRSARPISVPNYRTDHDRQHNLSSDRAQLWHDIIEDKSHGGYDPSVPVGEVDIRLLAAAEERLGHCRAALQREYDLVWCWLGYIDSVGHIDPCVDEAGWQRRHYLTAAELTRQVRDCLAPEDDLVVISDHGLRDGEHTHDPVVAGPDPIVERIGHVYDVAKEVDRFSPKTGETEAPDIRDQFTQPGESGAVSTDDVESRLKDLGYV